MSKPEEHSLASSPGLEGIVCCRCRRPLVGDEYAAHCPDCGAIYESSDGVLTMLPPSVALDTHPEEVYWRDLAPTQERPWRETKGHLARGLDRLFIDRQPLAGKALEIGAGFCWASSMVKAKHPHVTITASDISPAALRQAGTVCAEVGGAVDRFVACDMACLPFADDYFDWVFGVAVLHHATDVVGVLQDVRRVLKPGGRYFGLDEFATNRLFRWWWRASPFSPFVRRHSELHVREEVYTLTEWRRAFATAGFAGANVQFNRDWRLKRSEGFRRLYFRLTAALPEALFALLPGGSIVAEAQK